MKLVNGITIPDVGFGTWQTPDGETAVNAVREALAAGYRHIDTAAAYNNEASVGKAIAESGIDRSELFITTKLWNSERAYDAALKAFDRSLSELGLDYLDLYLIHWANNTDPAKNIETWRALETLYREKRVRAIGVCNFLPRHLEPLLTADVPVMVNQIEFHPGYMQAETVAFCKQHAIAVEAWSPLGNGALLKDETLAGIAAGYGVSVAQLCIKWCLQHGTIPLPKSVTPSRIRQNLELDFTLTEADMARIDATAPQGGEFNADNIDAIVAALAAQAQ